MRLEEDQNKYLTYEVYDFLEDEVFRSFVLKNEKTYRGVEADYLKKKNPFFQEAIAMLIQMHSHFDGLSLSANEIEQRIDGQIEGYLNREYDPYNERRFSNTWWRVAAVLLVLVAAIILFKWDRGVNQIYETGFGQQMVVTLSDGSTVSLNGNSKLIWKKDWKATGIRKATLEGEAYFNVTKQQGIAFAVDAGDVVIEVLGTTFNVNKREEHTDVFLESGKINLKLDDESGQELIMEPGDKVVYDVLGKQIEKIEERRAEESVSWKDGFLLYREESLLNVLKDLSDIYGKEFVFADAGLQDRRITATIPLMNWTISATAIQLSMNLQFSEQNDVVRITKKD